MSEDEGDEENEGDDEARNDDEDVDYAHEWCDRQN